MHTSTHTLPAAALRLTRVRPSSLCALSVLPGEGDLGNLRGKGVFWEWRGRKVWYEGPHARACHPPALAPCPPLPQRKATRCVCFGGHARVHPNHETRARAVCAKESSTKRALGVKRASGVHARAGPRPFLPHTDTHTRSRMHAHAGARSRPCMHRRTHLQTLTNSRSVNGVRETCARARTYTHVHAPARTPART